MKTTDRLIKAFEKFNEELEEFRLETGNEFAILYEDANTTREVKDFKLCKNGNLKYKERSREFVKGWETALVTREETDTHFDDDDIRDSLKFWRANLRRAKKYWSMDTDILDKIQDGEIEDTTDSDE